MDDDAFMACVLYHPDSSITIVTFCTVVLCFPYYTLSAFFKVWEFTKTITRLIVDLMGIGFKCWQQPSSVDILI